jgi:hypothetical protein
LETDLPVAEFLETHFGGRQYSGLRRTITRMVEGYDAADPHRASTFSLRDEWMERGLYQQGRIAEAMARSSSISHPNAAGRVPRSISALL